MGCIPQLEEIGINVELQVVDSGSHSALRSDPANGHDIGAWEVQKAVFNPVSATGMTGQSTGWWSSEKKEDLLYVIKNTRTGSEESIQAYTDLCQLITEEVPWIGFCTTISKTYTQPNVELNYDGIYAFYWNTYFTK